MPQSLKLMFFGKTILMFHSEALVMAFMVINLVYFYGMLVSAGNIVPTDLKVGGIFLCVQKQRYLVFERENWRSSNGMVGGGVGEGKQGRMQSCSPPSSTPKTAQQTQVAVYEKYGFTLSCERTTLVQNYVLRLLFLEMIFLFGTQARNGISFIHKLCG